MQVLRCKLIVKKLRKLKQQLRETNDELDQLQFAKIEVKQELQRLKERIISRSQLKKDNGKLGVGSSVQKFGRNCPKLKIKRQQRKNAKDVGRNLEISHSHNSSDKSSSEKLSLEKINIYAAAQNSDVQQQKKKISQQQDNFSKFQDADVNQSDFLSSISDVLSGKQNIGELNKLNQIIQQKKIDAFLNPSQQINYDDFVQKIQDQDQLVETMQSQNYGSENQFDEQLQKQIINQNVELNYDNGHQLEKNRQKFPYKSFNSEPTQLNYSKEFLQPHLQNNQFKNNTDLTQIEKEGIKKSVKLNNNKIGNDQLPKINKNSFISTTKKQLVQKNQDFLMEEEEEDEEFSEDEFFKCEKESAEATKKLQITDSKCDILNHHDTDLSQRDKNQNLLNKGKKQNQTDLDQQIRIKNNKTKRNFSEKQFFVEENQLSNTVKKDNQFEKNLYITPKNQQKQESNNFSDEFPDSEQDEFVVKNNQTGGNLPIHHNSNKKIITNISDKQKEKFTINKKQQVIVDEYDDNEDAEDDDDGFFVSNKKQKQSFESEDKIKSGENQQQINCNQNDFKKQQLKSRTKTDKFLQHNLKPNKLQTKHKAKTFSWKKQAPNDKNQSRFQKNREEIQPKNNFNNRAYKDFKNKNQDFKNKYQIQTTTKYNQHDKTKQVFRDNRNGGNQTSSNQKLFQQQNQNKPKKDNNNNNSIVGSKPGCNKSNEQEGGFKSRTRAEGGRKRRKKSTS